MKAPHLLPALIAVLVANAALVAGDQYARSVERDYVHSLAGQYLTVRDQGSALQSQALDQNDLLLVYGSSEFWPVLDSPYHPRQLLSTSPTGFQAFLSGHAGKSALSVVQDLAALGSQVRGKRVVFSVSPFLFFKDEIDLSNYRGNFSRLHATELVFSSDLSFKLKQAIAKRMLRFPETLESEPLLKFALERLADDSLLSRALYYATVPFGKLQALVLRFQDHWETLAFIRADKDELDRHPTHQAMELDWGALQDKAQQAQAENANNNPLGVQNDRWEWIRGWGAEERLAIKEHSPVETVSNSLEWPDTELLMQAAQELGAQVMILSVPLHGTYQDVIGFPPVARQIYHQKLREVAVSHGVPMLDFADHDFDKYFLTDPLSHLSRKGWVYYEQALDAFYHGLFHDYDGALAWYQASR